MPSAPALSSDMDTAVENIGPDEARHYLTLVPSTQRSQQSVTVTAYAKEMAEGRWRFTAEPITFDTENNLIQGQHRMAAVVRAGVTLPFLVVRGAPADSFAVVDIGRRRTASQFLNGKYQTHIMSGARALWLIERNQSMTSDLGWKNLAIDQQIAYAETWPELYEYAPAVNRIARITTIPGRMLMPVLAQTERTSYRHRIPGFIEFLETGVGAEVGDPRLALRERFMTGSDRRLIRVMGETDRGYSRVVKAWNAYATAKQMIKLTIADKERRTIVVGNPLGIPEDGSPWMKRI